MFVRVSALAALASFCAALASVDRWSTRTAFARHPRRLPQRPQRQQLSAVKLEGRTIQGEVKPLNNFVLVKVAAAQEKTDGGILLTGKAKIVKTQGRVVAAGPGRTHPDSGITISVPVEAGEGVVYGKYDGTEIEYNGAKHTLIRDDDVLVKFGGGGDELTLENAEVTRDNVLVRVDTSEKATEGGILIAKTSSADKRPSTGEVIKVGPGRTASNGELMPMEVSPGDMIKFRDFAGNEVEIEGQEYCVVKMADILAKF
jgi:chaperonin GroES